VKPPIEACLLVVAQFFDRLRRVECLCVIEYKNIIGDTLFTLSRVVVRFSIASLPILKIILTSASYRAISRAC